MNYKLAKELKDAGFPQKVSWGDFLYNDEFGNKILYTVKKEKAEAIDGLTKIPTLEELIDVMPMRKKYLGTVNDAHFVLRKLVGHGNIYKAYYEDEDTDLPVSGYEFTEKEASEAVAKLWLTLNKQL